jgi:diguanylate cyclase (GGDEF)-like protein
MSVTFKAAALSSRIVLCALFLFLTLPGMAQEEVRVLAVHSYTQEYPWTKGQHDGFIETLVNGVNLPVKFKTEYLDTKRLDYSEEYSDRFANYLEEKYQGFKPDGLYVTDDNGLLFGLKHLARLFPDTPLFFSGVNDYGVVHKLNPRLQTGVFEKKEPGPNIEFLEQILDLRRICIVGDASNTYEAIERNLRQELQFHGTLNVSFIAHQRISEIEARLESCSDAPVFLTTIGALQDNQGNVLSLQDSLQRIVKVSSGLVVSMEDAYLTKGVMGGYVTSGPAQGRAAASLMLANISGKPMEMIAPILRSPNLYVFDEAVLENLKIQLPSGLMAQAVLLNPIPGFYESNRKLIIGLLIIFAIALLVTLVIYTFQQTRSNFKLRAQSGQLLTQGEFLEQHAAILEMIASGKPASDVYDRIALMYEGRHPGMRCSLLELKDGKLLHGGAPSLPKEYCDAVHGLENGPNVGSCGTSTYTGQRVLVENIETDPKWEKIKHVALPHGMRSCWSEPIKNSVGKVLGAFGMYYNYPALPNEEESQDLKAAARVAGIVMERDQAQKRIRELAYLDELTGLASRAHFYQYIEETIKEYKRHKIRFAVLYIDLDDFKSVNDSLGHDAGDLLLKEIAQRLKFVSREIDFLARLSGDEFCILIKDVDDDCAANVAHRCLKIIADPIEIRSRRFTPTCSIGIAHFPDDGDDVSTLLKAADTSLYYAKGLGKNQFAFYIPELTRKAEKRFRVEHALRDAVENEQLSLVYQPQIEISTNRIIGLEALSRWHHPQLGEISPVEFIPTAERIGVIKPLTEWVLKTACTQAVSWERSGLPSIRLAINISPRHFLDADFVHLIKRVLKQTDMNASNLQLEVTENVAHTDLHNHSAFRDLMKLGVLVAIDDFGTGFSSFASLMHLTANCIKIDKQFIRNLPADPDMQLLVRSMIEIGHNLGREIIAEGVETEEQLEALKKLDCECAQGYFFSRPLSVEKITKLLEENFKDGVSVLSPHRRVKDKELPVV